MLKSLSLGAKGLIIPAYRIKIENENEMKKRKNEMKGDQKERFLEKPTRVPRLLGGNFH